MFASRHIEYRQTNSFTPIVTDYLASEARLSSFYSWPPSMDGLKKALESRKVTAINRTILVEVLKEQYQAIETNEKVHSNINSLLSANTFTITTAHQPNLFTGPLYFIYKILHAIRIADRLNKEWPGHHFVPVYYMGSEDADTDELNHAFISGKKFEWKTNQSGAVGRMTIDKDLVTLVNEMEGQLSVDPFGKEMVSIIRKCYSAGKTIQQASFEMVNELFRDYGLVVLIPDHPKLKKLLVPVFTDDIFKNEPSNIVSRTSSRLGSHYNVQAYTRQINLFYLEEGIRERIEKKGDKFQVVNTSLEFSADEILNLLNEHPERFSPNVILRGLFQEAILPNIAFIGGGGELAYWMQFQELFEHYQVPYPVLILRNSFLLLESKWMERLEKLGLSINELFLSEHDIMNLIVERYSGNKISLNGNFEKAEDLFSSLEQQASSIDPTLTKHVAAIRTRSLKTLQELEKKMIRAEKRKFSDQQSQINKLKQELFPGQGLQERVENLGGFYAKWGSGFIRELYEHSLTLEQQFTILTAEH